MISRQELYRATASDGMVTRRCMDMLLCANTLKNYSHTCKCAHTAHRLKTSLEFSVALRSNQ